MSVPPPRSENEEQRLQSLRALGILDTPPEERFDRLTRLACRLFGTPIALVSLVDADRQWFKAREGLDISETPRTASFCAHAILDLDVFVVPDALEDERFRENPLVLGAPGIRFYAGCPVRAPDGSPLGTLCVIDSEPRDPEQSDITLLRDLAEMVEGELRSLALAATDELTGITNRRGFDSIATHSLALCRRVGRPASLLLFDLDDFKGINDREGHAAGDEALQRFATELLSTFRDSDVVARWGGDEFCVLLSSTGEDQIERPLGQLTERLLSNGAQSPLHFSVGVAQYDPERHGSTEALVADADERMYQAKRGEA